VFKSIGLTILSAVVFTGCASENKLVSLPQSETPKTQTIAVGQVEVVETPRFIELRNQFQIVEAEVRLLSERRERLLVNYTEEYPGVIKVSKELTKAKEKLKIAESLLNAEREKLEYRVKNSPV